MKTYVVTPHYNRLDETVVMVGLKYVLWQIWLIPELSLLPLLIWITVVVFMVIGSGGV